MPLKNNGRSLRLDKKQQTQLTSGKKIQFYIFTSELNKNLLFNKMCLIDDYLIHVLYFVNFNTLKGEFKLLKWKVDNSQCTEN